MKATFLIVSLLALAAYAGETHPSRLLDDTAQVASAGLPTPGVTAQEPYQPAPYSAAVAGLVNTITGADLEAALDLFLAPATRFSPTEGRRAVGVELAERLRSLGYIVEEDAYYTALRFQSIDYVEGRLCVVGSAGLIYTSDDDGASWTRRDDTTRPFTLNEVAIAADDSRFISAGGSSNRYLQSEDGGRSWVEVELPLSGSGAITGLQRPEAETIYLSSWSAAGSTLLRSTDGGASWTAHDLGFGAQPYAVFGLEFIDVAHGWATGYRSSGQQDIGCIARTTDGGLSWSLWSTPGRIFVNASFADPLRGYAVANDREAIYRTTDGGVSWELCHEYTGPSEPEFYEYLGDIRTLSADHAVAVGYGGVVLETRDGGDTWSYLREPVDHPDFGSRISLAALDVDRWLAVGDGAFESTADGGDYWHSHLPELGLPPAVNIFAYRPGSGSEEGPLVIAAYDCVSEDPWNLAPGADANGSGAVALLATAEALAGLEPVRSLGLLFTSSRYMPGGFGRTSTDRFRSVHPDYRPRGVVNFEAVGYTADDNRDVFLLGNAPDEGLMRAVAAYARDYVPGLGVHLKFNAFPFNDIGPFWEAGIPGAYCSEHHAEPDDYNYRRGTIQDTRDSLDPALLMFSARLATAFLAAEANLEGGLPVAPVAPYVFPNPFRPDRGHQTITFAGMPPGGEVRVYTLDGLLLHVGYADHGPFHEGETPTWRHHWDGTNDHGNPVAAGVYLYRADGPGGFELGRFAVIR